MPYSTEYGVCVYYVLNFSKCEAECVRERERRGGGCRGLVGRGIKASEWMKGGGAGFPVESVGGCVAEGEVNRLRWKWEWIWSCAPLPEHEQRRLLRYFLDLQPWVSVCSNSCHTHVNLCRMKVLITKATLVFKSHMMCLSFKQI